MIEPAFTLYTGSLEIEVWPCPGARRWHWRWVVGLGCEYTFDHGRSETLDDARNAAIDAAWDVVDGIRGALLDEEMPA